jgi:hypothetical protein
VAGALAILDTERGSAEANITVSDWTITVRRAAAAA